MKHQDKYDALCRALTDYEGYGTDDEEVIGDIDYVVAELEDIAKAKDLASFVECTISRTIDINNPNYNADDIYDMAVRLQNNWDDIWVGRK